MDNIIMTIKQVGIFTICAQMILHLKPSKNYEKYMKLLISVMVLAQLIVPALQFFTRIPYEEFEMKINEYQTLIDEKIMNQNISEENIGGIQTEMIEKEINSRLNNDFSERENILGNSDENNREKIRENNQESKQENNQKVEQIQIDKIEVHTDDR